MEQTRRILIILSLTLCSLSAQNRGGGIPSSLGQVPRIGVDHRAVAVPNVLTLSGFAPGSQVHLLVAFSANPTPLQTFGFGPAVLGPDPNSPNGAVTFSGFVADAQGQVVIPFSGDPTHAHWQVHMQAFALDAAALHGAAFSDHEILVFGQDRERLAIGLDVGAGREALLQVFPYGALAAAVDDRLIDVDFLPLILANSNEMGPGRIDRVTPVQAGQPEDGLRLSSGDRLYRLQKADGSTGFVIRRVDESLDILAWAPGTLIEPAFAEEVAVSDFDPYVALAAENPLAGYGQATLLVARTDGNSLPQSHLKWFGVQAPGGYDIESSSLCFLQGALFFGDGETRLDRLDLQTMTITPVVFPPSGGATPIYVDESMVAAAGGGALALGAGVDKNNHDIYVVDAAGNAINLSNLPGDYEDAGPGEADGMQLAISDDGSVVAYMRTVTENELFMRATAPGSPEIPVTHAAQYINSIDTVVGLGFKTNATSLVFSAGKSETEVDAYEGFSVSTGVVNLINNLTITSGMAQPVFGLGASLSPRTYRSTPLGYMLEYQNSNGPDRLQVVGGSSSLPFDIGTLVTTSALTTDAVVVDQLANGTLQLRVIVPALPSIITTVTSSPAVTVLGMSSQVTRFAVLVDDAFGGQVYHYEEGMGMSFGTGPIGMTEGGIALTPDGRLMALVRDPVSNLRKIHEFDFQNSTWSVVSTLNNGTTGLRFLP